jgi:hypothetical protein
MILVSAVLIMTVSPWGQVQSDDADKNRPEGKVIFEIGQEDNSDGEFLPSVLYDESFHDPWVFN